MKLLFTSDWHLDHVTAGKSRFDEVCNAVDETVRTAIQEKCDHYFFLGDLMDPDSGSVTYRALKFANGVMRRLRDAEITSHWLAGNHDVVEDGYGTTTLTPLCSLGRHLFAHVYEYPEVNVFSGLTIVALPFTATSHAYDPGAFIKQASVRVESIANVPTVVIGHLNVVGVIPGEETNEMPRGREVVFPREQIRNFLPNAHLFHGHYHRRQVHDGVHIPGALARLTFGEELHDPGYMLVEIPNGE